MSIKAALQAKEINKFGYARVKVAGAWYGSDKKGSPPSVEIGDIVEFDAYKNERNYDTFKFQSFKKVASKPANSGPADTGPVASKDEYWAAKEKNDAAKEPRINYFAALDRAISFVDLALRNGAVGAYEKAKATGKLEVLTALVYETTQRIIAEAYAQKIPAPGEATEPAEEAAEEESAEADDGEANKWA